MKIHRGTYYFETEEAARTWAAAHGWPVDCIRDYGHGYAVQAGDSGSYAGPGEDETPRPWRGAGFLSTIRPQFFSPESLKQSGGENR